MNIDKSISNTSNILRDEFAAWLSFGHAKKYEPNVYLSCINIVSEYLIQKKIAAVDLWQLAEYYQFADVYFKAVNDRIFKATKRNIYERFVYVGHVYLEFLKWKSSFSSDKCSEKHSQVSNQLTVKKAIIAVLQLAEWAMTVDEIYNEIIAAGLYSFGAQNPQKVIRVEIDRACENSKYTTRASKNRFKFERNHKGEKVYYLLKDIPKIVTAHTILDANAVPTVLTETKTKPSNVEIWNDDIEHRFRCWMESGNYAPTTARNYCSAVKRIITSFNPLVDYAVSNSQSIMEAVCKLIALLQQDSNFLAANNSVHNQLSAALAALSRFVDKESSGAEKDANFVHSVTNTKLDHFVDLEEGKREIREILNAHFLTLYGYSNVGILWNAAQNSLPMFLNDNAINSTDDLWCFLICAFKDEYILYSPHIWQNAPDYPRSSRGLVMNLARQHGGVVSRDQIDDFFSRIKLTTLNNSLVLDCGQILFFDNAKFILTEIINPTTERRAQISNALNMIFSSENTPFIVLRDISSLWYYGLPGLPNGLQWTPLLLQEMLRICPDIDYRIISSDLKGQALDTLGAAIVPDKSEIKTFADVVHRFSFEKYKLPLRLSAEELRLDLRAAGMLDGNELIFNMHKALKDYRFAFFDENRTVKIMER